ncbi:MAG: hypothetical protein ACRCTG_16560 [Aestuariivirga sp.]
MIARRFMFFVMGWPPCGGSIPVNWHPIHPDGALAHAANDGVYA